MKGRRTAHIIGIAVLLSLPGSLASARFFDERSGVQDERAPVVSVPVGIPLEDLVREQALPFMEEMAGLPSGAVLEIETGQAASVTADMLQEFRYEPVSGRFTAIAISSEFGNFNLRGRAAISVPVTMPVRRIEAGEVIGSADLAPVMMPVSSLNVHVLSDVEDIVGKEAKRSLMAERPIAAQSLIAPLVVKRGAPVLISLSEGSLSLSAPGKSLQDAGIGEIIRVVNTHSNKTLHALVTGEGNVSAVGVPVNQ